MTAGAEPAGNPEDANFRGENLHGSRAHPAVTGRFSTTQSKRRKEQGLFCRTTICPLSRGFLNNRNSQILVGKIPFMDTRIVLSLALVLAVVLACAGCSQPEQPVVTPNPTPVPTPRPTTPPTPVPTTQASVLPGPTDTLPPQWPVSVTVEKGGMYSTTIITKFDGGKGLVYVTRMDVRVTHPDGTVLMNGLTKPKMGDSVEIAGTNGIDRVEVMLLMASGDTYKIIDKQMPYKSY